MKDNEGRRMMMHPAWQAAHELLSDGETWWQTLNGDGGYSDAQIVTAMRCMGFGADVIETEWKGAQAVAWELPHVWIPIDRNNELDAFPRLMAMLELPTLHDALNDPAWFVAGMEEVSAGTFPLPASALAVLNGVGE